MNYIQSRTYIEDLEFIACDTDLVNRLARSKVLVTGATGLIASVFIDTLIHCGGIQVYALCRSPERARMRFGERVNHVIQDVNEPLSSTVKFDYIIHAASNAHPLAYAQAPVDTMKANIIGTVNMLEYARIHDVRRVMFVSSSEVYGVNITQNDNSQTQDRCDCIDLADLRSAYPESKRASEVLCASYRCQYNINTVCVRPWYVYGATFGEVSSRADAQFLRKAFAGEDIIMKSAGTQTRSYCYVSDCVTAMLKVLLNGENGAYNIAGKDNVTIQQFAEIIAETAHVGILFEEPSATERSGYTKAPNSVCGEQRAQRTQALGYVPRYSVADGIERTLKIMREAM
jgi:nucleoside-diphosphate-sugar epimerase